MATTALSPWLEHRNRTEPCTLIVLHATAGGDVDGAVETLREKGFSYHYIIDKFGDVLKCVPSESVAYHAGNSYGPNEAHAGISRHQDSESNFTANTSVNRYSMGISFVNLNDGHEPITPEQIYAGEELVRELQSNFPILYLTTHAIVSPGRKTDPITLALVHFADAVNLPVWRPA